jgi:hypothetical protein
MPQASPGELARRIEALDRPTVAEDFDRVSWLWLVLLGVLLPIVLLILGWSS